MAVVPVDGGKRVQVERGVVVVDVDRSVDGPLARDGDRAEASGGSGPHPAALSPLRDLGQVPESGRCPLAAWSPLNGLNITRSDPMETVVVDNTSVATQSTWPAG